MHKIQMDVLNTVGYLHAINTTGGKSQGAESAGVTADTMSKYIENLEGVLGYKLLSSNSRGSSLTDRGKLLLGYATNMEKMAREILSTAMERKEICGEVLIGISLMVASSLLLKDLGDFYDKYPAIKLNFISTMDSSAINNSSDVDISVTTEVPIGENVIVYSKKMEMGFFASPYYLAHHLYPENFEDLLQNHCILDRGGIAKRINGWSELIKKSKRVCFTTNSTYSLYEAIRNGAGIGIMPLHFKDEGMVCLDNLKCESNVMLYLVAHKDTKDTPKIRTALNYLQELMENV